MTHTAAPFYAVRVSVSRPLDIDRVLDVVLKQCVLWLQLLSSLLSEEKSYRSKLYETPAPEKGQPACHLLWHCCDLPYACLFCACVCSGLSSLKYDDC